MGTVSDFMARAKSARASGGGYNYFKAGQHLIRVNNITHGITRKKIGYVALEGTILWTNSADGSMRPGSVAHWMITADKDAFEGNLKRVIMAVHNLTEDEVNGCTDEEWAEVGEDTIGQKQAGAGKLLSVRCVDKKSEKGNEYVLTLFDYFGDKDAKWHLNNDGLPVLSE